MDADERKMWGAVQEIVERVVGRGEPLELTDETRAIVQGGARLTAIAPEEAEAAVESVPAAVALLQEIDRRVDTAAKRVWTVSSRTDRLTERGDYAGARKLLEAAIAAEVVPYYRARHEDELEEVRDMEAVFMSGRVNPDLPEWPQVRVLGLRLEHGMPLELTDELRAFLRENAESVAIDTAETEQALRSTEGAAALLGKMAGRLREGAERLKAAMRLSFERQDAGDREGALQPLRDLLTVEVVPRYREAAEELIEGYDKPPPAC